MANLSNYATALSQIATADGVPTLATDGAALTRGARYLHLLCSTSGDENPTVFRVWHYWSGHDASTTTKWALDRSLGSNGSITISATTDPALLLSVEAPGERVYVEATTITADTLLDVDAIEVVES